MRTIATYSVIILVVGYVVIIGLLKAIKTHKKKRVARKSRRSHLERKVKEIINKD